MISIDLNCEIKKHPWENEWWHHQSYAVTQGKAWSCGVTVGPSAVTWREAVLEVSCGPVSQCSLHCGGYDLNRIRFLFL